MFFTIQHPEIIFDNIMNVKNYNYIILIIGLTIFSIVSIIATFGYKYFKKKEKDFLFIFLVSLFFGILSYCVKIPLLYYYGQQDSVSTYILSIVILTFILILHSKFILNEKVKIHTYVIIFLMVFLVLLEKYLSGF
jgi:hypothetical protein